MNLLFGDIVKVTPSSKVVGDMALFLVNNNMTMEQFEQLAPDHNLTLPTSVVEMFMGSLGEPDGGWPKKLQKIILRGREAAARAVPARTCRRSISTRPQRALEKKIGRKPSHDDVLSYLMYPDVFLKFARSAPAVRRRGRAADAAFFYGMERGEEIAVEIEPGKTLIIKFLTVGEPHPDGTRTVFFELNGQPREVTVRDRKLDVEGAAASAKADPNDAGPDRRADSRAWSRRSRCSWISR